jgi:hypothetical protein
VDPNQQPPKNYRLWQRPGLVFTGDYNQAANCAANKNDWLVFVAHYPIVELTALHDPPPSLPDPSDK